MKQLPLAGVRVADLSMMWAGPYATRILAEMGAEVLKIESPRAWDNIRTLVPQENAPEPWNSAFYFNDYNRDKKSVTLDLAQARGREVFLDLIRHCDVLIENYRADVMENLGLTYDVVTQYRPDLVMVSMAGFGKTGPERDYVGFGPIIEQMAGLASKTGFPEDGIPMKTGISYGDPVAGIAAVGAVVLGLIQRRKTGRGTWVDLAQRETMAAQIGEAFVAASLRGEDPVRRGNRSARWAPQGVYRCAGTEQWLAVSVRSDTEWDALAGVIGAAELAGLPLDQRRARHDELDARIEAWTAAQDPQDAMEALQAAGVPAGRVLDTLAIHDDKHLTARGYWVDLPHPKSPPWRQPSTSWRMLEANPQLRRHAPLFGEHTREVLSSLLGLTATDLAALESAQVIADAPINPTVG
ncbi:MAG: CoA transferase [Dehalococcoidia bacterium]|nr:CoA transferase [Dehalococcoidia bacterium]